MNEHLKPVFEILLPKLEEAQIDYWVFGGVSIAAYAGKFIRENKDIDIFVKEIDFKKTRLLLDSLCKQANFKLKYHPQKGNEKPKIDIEINDEERFSVIPVYQKNNTVLFKYKDGDQEYPNQILERIERNISGYKFFTSQNKFIKDMFIKHIEARPNKKNRSSIKTDTKAIFTPE